MRDELRRLDRGVPQYFYRRRLTPRELLPAIGVGVGAGLAAFYVACVLTQRTSLTATDPATRRPAGRRSDRDG